MTSSPSSVVVAGAGFSHHSSKPDERNPAMVSRQNVTLCSEGSGSCQAGTGSGSGVRPASAAS
ncbi:hypothetical protein APS67_005553 [Streptomyces sp. AVP053U2]|nr:hypothetical protein APS67_005553 [Streptomyces sp. AVP053U2]